MRPLAKTVTMKGRKLRIVRTRTHTNFRPVYYDWLDTIAKNSWRQRVPGWNREDIQAEMTYCLWVAYRTHDRTKQPDFGVFFWSVWLNHRTDQIRWYNRQKRAAEELPFTHDELIALSPVIFPGQLVFTPEEVTNGEDEPDEIARVAWSLLAFGYLPSEVQAALHLNNHRYYAIIDSWRTDAVYDWLTGQY